MAMIKLRGTMAGGAGWAGRGGVGLAVILMAVGMGLEGCASHGSKSAAKPVVRPVVAETAVEATAQGGMGGGGGGVGVGGGGRGGVL